MLKCKELDEVTEHWQSERVIHVWAPALEWKRKHPGISFPIVALRLTASSPYFFLFDRIDILGPSTIYDGERALVGTGGKASCLIRTQAALKCWYDPERAGEDRLDSKWTPETIINHVLKGADV